jgi:hypothetical protein
MNTTIDNNLRVFHVRTTLGRDYFCNITQLNEVIKFDGCKPGYFKIFDFRNGKPKRVSKKDLALMFEGSELKQEFGY